MLSCQKKNGLSIIINNCNEIKEVKRQSRDKIDVPLNEVLNEEIPFRMWSVQSDKIKQYKKRVNYTINKHTIDKFKIVADKDMRKMSNIVENLIRRYVESRV